LKKKQKKKKKREKLKKKRRRRRGKTLWIHSVLCVGGTINPPHGLVY